MAGYRSGDIAVVARDLEPREGDVVLVRTEGEMMLRRYQSKKEGTNVGGGGVGNIVTGRHDEEPAHGPE